MDQLIVNDVTYWLPSTEAEVIDLVNEAQAHGEVICLRGSAHSFPLIGDIEHEAKSGRKRRYVMMSKMNAVSIDKKRSTVTVQSGCKLGLDPFDPTGISKKENALCYLLNKAGLALPDLGGIIHQSVGGFLSTGSSGGTTEFSFDDLLLSIDLIQFGKNGAEKVTYTRPKKSNPDHPFYAMGIGLGIMGIITSVTLKCYPKFYIVGQEAILPIDESEVDLFGDGEPGATGAEEYFKKTQYTRLLWWPQEHVDKLVVWRAAQATKSKARAYAAIAYKKEGIKKHPKLKPYHEVPYILNSPTPATAAADLMFTALGRWPNWLLDTMGDTIEYKAIKKCINTIFYPTILPKLLDIFVPIDDPYKGPQRFADVWWKGLPMDNQMSDKLMPVRFTELWIPLDRCQEVFIAMRDFYKKSNKNTGTFSCEIYAGKASKFWMSPSYDTDVIRIDVFWFANNDEDPTAYYQLFWDLLAPFQFRPHWGKYLPAGDSNLGSKYLKKRYPKWKQWMQLRAQVDPNQVFVNDYWRDHLGIAPSKGQH